MYANDALAQVNDCSGFVGMGYLSAMLSGQSVVLVVKESKERDEEIQQLCCFI